MKPLSKLLLFAMLAAGSPVAGNAATLTQAQLTIIIKDVKTIDPGKGARPAVIKETVQGGQSVRTGIASRTELYFNDKTITRLGANTHFSFSEGTRSMSLQSGAMLLQVPKGIGGATVETPAVTAGVTGTTIMLLSDIKFTKFIVLEGNGFAVVKWRGGKTSGKIWVRAGQEIVFINGSGKIPVPVFVNLKLLESTSLLINGKWGVKLNYTPIYAAAHNQPPGNYAVNGADAGAGSDTLSTIEKFPQNPGSQLTTNTAPPPPSPPPPPPPPPTRPPGR